MVIEHIVGPRQSADGTPIPLRLTRDGAAVTDAVHGRYSEMVARGNAYMTFVGLAGVALAATTVSTTAATATPIVGFLNPANSGVICAVQLSGVGAIATGASTVAEGGYFYQIAGNPGLVAAYTTITGGGLGASPQNLKTQQNTGSKCIGAGGTTLVAFTGNTATWQSLRPVGGTTSQQVARTSSVSCSSFQTDVVDGLIQIAPGQALGIFNETSTTTVTAAGFLVWEEVPLFYFA